jgi:hypothetical protein
MENQEKQLRRTSDKTLIGLINPLFRPVKQSHKITYVPNKYQREIV